MTTLEYNQIKEIFKPVKSADELQKINNDISHITYILSTIPFNTEFARQKIISINNEYPENRVFSLLIYPPDGECIPVCSASSYFFFLGRIFFELARLF